MPMTPTNAMSGRFGCIELGLGEPPTPFVWESVRNWQVSRLNEVKEFRASNTRGGTGRRAGINDWNGTFSQFGKSGITSLLPGEKVIFTGYAGPMDGITPGAVGAMIKGPAMIASLSHMWDWTNNEILTTDYQMAGNGPLIYGPHVFMRDLSMPSVPSVAGLGPTITSYHPTTGEELLTFQPCVQSATFNLTINPMTFANSCTGNWRQRNPGPVDWTYSMVLDQADLYNTDMMTIQPGAIVSLDLPVLILPDLTVDQWTLYYGMVIDYSNYTVNIETGEIITYTVNIAMNIDPVDGAAVEDLGAIWPPGIPTSSAPWWPFASIPASPALDEAGLTKDALEQYEKQREKLEKQNMRVLEKERNKAEKAKEKAK